MSYTAIASSIKSNAKSLNTGSTAIKNISFDSIWSGDAHDKLTSNLKNVLAKIAKINESINSFSGALENLETYKNNKEQITKLTNEKNSLDTNSENYNSRKNTLTSQINSLTEKNRTLKSSINSAISGISSISSELNLVNSTPDNGYKEYVVDLYDFLKTFQSGNLTKISDNGSLYNYYSQDEVNNRINQIKQQYSGRDAAVNCALGVMQMAAKVGKKLDYDYGGGHTPTTSLGQVATGTDCSSFVSWAINQGTNSTFNTTTTYGLINQGKHIDYSAAQKGDILVNSGHVVMVVDNDSSKGQVLVAEASGSNTGVVLRTRSYTSLANSAYQARDLSSIYNT